MADVGLAADEDIRPASVHENSETVLFRPSDEECQVVGLIAGAELLD